MSLYQHGRRTKRTKNPKVILHTAVVLGVALIVVAVILQKDLSSRSNEKTTVPIVTEVGAEAKEVIKINEPLFTMELPADWKLTKRVTENYANFYEWHSTKKGGDDRRLLLHIDIMPRSYKIVRMQPLSINGNKFVLGNISSECMEFAKDTDRPETRSSNQEVEAKWESVRFVCDPIEANQTIGTGTVDGGIVAQIGQHKYFFYYEDHNIRPDEKIFQDALRSFQAK